MKTFQVEQFYGEGCGGYVYFTIQDSASEKEIEKQAIKCVRDHWNKVNPALYFTAPRPCRPTVKVYEYKDGKRIKGGIQFKTKWR